MAGLKTSKYIVTDVKTDLKLPSHRSEAERTMDGTGGMPTRVMWLDSDVVSGAFYSECVWIWPHCASERPAAGEHTHPFEEVITFFGTNFEDPHDLGGEVELWLDGEKHVMTKSFLAYIPAGMKHCPLIVRRVDRPIFHFTVGPGQQYA
jgi:hypothetical protein